MSQTQCNSHSLLTVMIDYIKNDTNLLTITALLMLCLMLFVLLPSECFAETLDYQELQEEPLETAFRKLTTSGSIEWDDDALVPGGAPDILPG